MPVFVPFVITAAAGTIAAYGAKKLYGGARGVSEAKRRIDAAKKRHERRVRQLESSRERLRRRFDALRELREETAESTLGRMVELLARLERRGSVSALEEQHWSGLEPRPEVRELVGQLVDAGKLVRGGLAALGAGVAAQAATTTLAGSSTGTAISSLSGAAASNAVLAWLGGGSLAAGGGGMAAGTVVLGSIAVAPVVLVGGVVVAAQGEKAREQATKYEAEVDTAIAQLNAVVSVMLRAERRAVELSDVTRALAARAARVMDHLEEVAERFDDGDPDHLERLRSALLLCHATRRLLDCRVLDDDGQLDAATEELLASVRGIDTPDPRGAVA